MLSWSSYTRPGSNATPRRTVVPVDSSAFPSANAERLFAQDVARRFFDAVVRQAQAAGLLSDEHFSVDGTLIEACASLKSFKRRTGVAEEAPPDDPGNPTVNFHGERRSTRSPTCGPCGSVSTGGQATRLPKRS